MHKFNFRPTRRQTMARVIYSQQRFQYASTSEIAHNCVYSRVPVILARQKANLHSMYIVNIIKVVNMYLSI